MSQYFDREPEVESAPFTYAFDFEGRRFEMTSDRGVFSSRHLDQGSQLLLQTAVAELRAEGPRGGRLLDVGCGIGVLGLVLKRVFPAFELTAIDVNARALELTRRNLRDNGVAYAEVLQSDGWEALGEQRFDLIVMNPPIRAGKRTVYRLFAEASRGLAAGGRCYIVIGRKQGSESAARELARHFGAVTRSARRKGFDVYRCEADAGQPDAQVLE